MRRCLPILLLLALCSCRTPLYSPYIGVDTVYVSKVQRDSIYVHDSVSVTEQGDTVREYVCRYVYRDRYLTDTLHHTHTDTVAVEIPAQLTGWQRFRMDAGTAALVIAALAVIVLLLRLFGLRL